MEHKFIFFTAKTFPTCAWDEHDYSLLTNKNWSDAVALAKRYANIYGVSVRLASFDRIIDPYRLSGSYFNPQTNLKPY